MSDYRVMLTQRAVKDMDEIYRYILEEFRKPETAERVVCILEEAVYSLCGMPYRGAERKQGIYADKGYRQLFVKNFTIVYRIKEQEQSVIIMTVRYTPSNF